MHNTCNKILLVLSLIILLTNCQSRKNNSVEDMQTVNYDYPYTSISDTLVANVNDESELFPLQDDVLESFLDKARDFEGRKWTAKVSIPSNWGVVCVERLQEGKELWKLQSENRELIYLITTSGYGTQRILDVLPVALNISNQQDDDLETENWQTYRLPDGQFRTVKEYEWVHSMTNATKQDFINDPGKFHKKSKYTEQFLINEQGRFEIVENIDTMPDYNAVIFFFNPSDKPLLWDENIPLLQAFCEENGILFEEISQNFDRVTIRDYELTFAIETDINEYVKDNVSGMVMMTKGETPKAVHFGSLDYMQMEIRRYFKIRSESEL